MRKLRLSIALPAIQCSLGAALLRGGVHLAPLSPGLTEAPYPHFSSYAELALGLNPPAVIATTLIYGLANRLWNFVSPRPIGSMGFDVIFLTCVLVIWFLIGNWLDHRATTDESAILQKPTLTGFFLRLIPLGVGIFFVAVFGIYQGFFRAGGLSWPVARWTNLYSLRWNLRSIDEVVALSMFRTWGVFLIASPMMTFVRWAWEFKRREVAHQIERQISKPRFRLRWFLTASAVFAVLFVGTVIFGR